MGVRGTPPTSVNGATKWYHLHCLPKPELCYNEGGRFVVDLGVNNEQGRPTKLKTVKEYCTRGYEYYAWKTYTYTDSHRKHLQSVKWEYKKVL